MVEDVLEKSLRNRKINSTNLNNSPATQANTTMETEIALGVVRRKLETFQATLMDDVQKKVDAMVEDVIQEIRQYEMQTNEFKEFAKSQHNQLYTNRQSSSGSNSSKDDADSTARTKRTFADKVFVPRESFLTSLLQVDHMKSIYHIFFVIFFLIFLNSAFSDYFLEGRVNFGLGTVKGGFKGLHYVLAVWSALHVLVFGLFYAFGIWARVRCSLRKKKSLQSAWSYTCIAIFISLLLTVGYIGVLTCFVFNLPYVSSIVILLESVRLIMKMYAFVRTNAAIQLAGKPKSDNVANVRLPPFSSYLYYLFAPTFIYRDSYPRTKQIRWRFALARFTEGFGIAMIYSYIYERYMLPSFGNFGLEPLTAAGLTVKIFGMLMPGSIIYLGGFYLMLHAWLNFTSELLRFADRMFYKDWWTASNYEIYYRNWNVVIHDFLYEYVYKDMYKYVFRGSKLASSLFVFFVSACVHEHVIGFGFKFFYPVMFFLFMVVGVMMIFLTKQLPQHVGNVSMWFSLLTGNGFMISLYLMEHFARKNCPVGDGWQESFVPISWRCNGITPTQS